jgi:hypothetical protein
MYKNGGLGKNTHQPSSPASGATYVFYNSTQNLATFFSIIQQGDVIIPSPNQLQILKGFSPNGEKPFAL